jgi:fluoroacetyl-CoA thioesterase
MNAMLAPNDCAGATIVVQPADTAVAIAIAPSDAFPEVFATARMIALMEVAAARVLRPHCAEGQVSVGVGIAVRHVAATPIGARVRAVATYLGPEGRLLRFRVEAYDESGLIGEGEHTRALVTADRLLRGAEKRRSAA